MLYFPNMSTEIRLTPMLTQYKNLKARFPDAILLFRLGDFYETFEDDAKTCARELELVLTHRSFAKGVRLPMAGVPHHHVQAYIAKLIDKGFKVALVEQLEDPKKVKRLVKRDVVRVITPGTVVEDALLKSKSQNYLAAIAVEKSERRETRHEKRSANPHPPSPVFGLAFIDLSTGEFATTQIDGVDAQSKLFDELERVQASEYVVSEALAKDEEFIARLSAIRPARVSPTPNRAFETDTARELLLEHFRVNTLHAFGCEELSVAISAAGAALHYLKNNQPNADASALPLQHLNHLFTYSLDAYMTLDAATRRNLELTASLAPDSNLKNTARSLFGVLDCTETAMGARMLRRWIQQPLLDLEKIRERQDAVAELHRDAFLRADVRKLLDGLYDVERLVGRIGFGTANARDLIGLKRALLRIPKIKTRLNDAQSKHLRALNDELDELGDVRQTIDRALVDDPPILIKEGGLIKESFDPTLDELRDGAAASREWLAELEERERKRTGIKTLRVRYNEVFGFFIEAPRRDAKLIPKEYERRATISHAERYVTQELKAREQNILATQDRAKDLEYELFTQIRREVASHAARLQSAARILAQLDALGSLAQAAANYNYVQPIVDDGDALEIREGRHPIVERFLRENEIFVPNDARLEHETQRVLILTGPNMSGKSVFIRQVALIVLMAQIGSFVPASFARIGLTDRIFTRVGASDDIAQGRSTFLVEMSETSHILRHATPRSLIVLDEVGRGTSTYDGISLAWAIAEELHNLIGAKTLFATHYHELTQLADAPSIEQHGGAVKNFTMAVQERDNSVIFLRQVIEGGAEKSFGIHVAQLAGLPQRVIERANQVLSKLESEREGEKREAIGEQREIEDARSRRSLTPKDETRVESETAQSDARYAIAREEKSLYDVRVQAWREVLRELSDADIANMTPVQALVLLNEMQVRIKEMIA
ncbi:MAG: DNA mismatch repair protein MutS [Chloroflexota bacterium]|nr:MAG: DNA mismatch repair protein MutS [Chloroflexota bacterium]